MNKLYLVAVPIGNLEEITYLGKRMLTDCKTIFCEDTRVTKQLLNLLNIWNNQELIKLNQFNEKESIDLIISTLNSHDCALVSDAGYPVISDPGYFVVSDLRTKGIPIQVVNGPCAFVHAIVSSGIRSKRIYFASFLTKKRLQRKKELENFKNILREASVVYYESKAFLMTGLELIQEVFGDIKIGVCRELSKLNENFYYDVISNLKQNIVFKGEFVVIIPQQNFVNERDLNLEEIFEELDKKILNKEGKLKELCKSFSNSKYTTKEIYTAYVQRERKDK